MKKQHYMLVNLVYGSQQTGLLYVDLWLNNHLKSLLDSTNIPALKEKGYVVEYVLFTDEESLQHISRHPNFMALSAICEITVIKLAWPQGGVDKFQARYSLLAEMIKQTFQAVYDPNDSKRIDAWITFTVADHVFAKKALPKMLSHMEKGHDAVLMMPMRAAADALHPILSQLPGAPDAMSLFEMCYANMHHLWVASLWDSPLFSKFPYSILWHSNTGVLSHNFGITPIVIKPTREMLNAKGVMDADVPAYAQNPYFAEDWLDAPVVGVEPLSNGHYPPFSIHQASVAGVVEWAKKGTMPEQLKFVDRPIYFPSKKIFNASSIAARAQGIVDEIKEKLSAEPAIENTVVPLRKLADAEV